MTEKLFSVAIKNSRIYQAMSSRLSKIQFCTNTALSSFGQCSDFPSTIAFVRSYTYHSEDLVQIIA